MKRSRWIALAGAALARCPRDRRHRCRRKPAPQQRCIHGDAARVRPARRRARSPTRTSSTPGASRRVRRRRGGSPTTAPIPRRSTTQRERPSRHRPPGRSSSRSRARRPGTVFYGGTQCSVSNGTTMVPGEVHLRDGVRHDSRLASGHGLDGHRLRRLEVGRRLQGPRDRGRLALRDRLPQRPGGHRRRQLEAREEAGRVQRSEAAEGLRAVRHPEPRAASSS